MPIRQEIYTCRSSRSTGPLQTLQFRTASALHRVGSSAPKAASPASAPGRSVGNLSVSAIGLRRDFQVAYVAGNRFALIDDMVPLI
ncbi:hypothetical protein GCM10023195_11150 [Actinoallomurus liliacearum]|uniref:Uncharacterized protein n=1 Tax=Actinoallomurus liliacearum TaxID=1080073 RepID=A0ABP8TBD2_9ACTN